LIKRPGVASLDSAIRQRNVNDFLKHVPVGVLHKGTRLLRVARDQDGMNEAGVDFRKEDGYSFFALQKEGCADPNGNRSAALVQMQLTRDVHIFFIDQYSDIAQWHGEPQPNGTYRIDKKMLSAGNCLARAITEDAWPPQYRPLGWASCSECELAFHDSIVADIMHPVAAKVRPRMSSPGMSLPRAPAMPRPAQPLPTNSVMDVRPPWWMGPCFHDGRQIREAERLSRSAKKEVPASFFEIDLNQSRRPAAPDGQRSAGGL
jgi:hypothetical protein